MNSQQSPTLQSFLQDSQNRVNENLSDCLQLNIPGKNLKSAMEYACLGGGKRIRPVLAYGGAVAVGGTKSLADNAAMAVELIHAYSLVHDDLPAMDDDDLRRGRPTVHKRYDEATAILVGDALQALAFNILSRQQHVSADVQLQMLRLLSDASGACGMVGGQALDFEAVGNSLTLEQLQQMHSLKTGALIRSAVVMGGLSHSGVSQQQLAALEEYASNLGLAFQVHDDILDVTGDTETLGKPQGSDKELNKPTYVTLLGLESARDKAQQLSDQAIAALDDFSDSANHLRELASYVIQRIH
jgi:geranylgeranyl diphosphate synthase, type II